MNTTPMTSHELNARFSAEGVRFEDGPGGLVRVRLEARGGEAEIFLHGAHVAQFTPRGHAPLLFTSRESLFAPGQPIRGGVPVIFPWFGPLQGNGALHGTVRLVEWQVESAQVHEGQAQIVFAYAPEAPPHEAWPGRVALRYIVTVSDSLSLQLEVKNLDEKTIRYEEALHTYFSVGDVRQVEITGLAGARFLDKTDGFAEKAQEQGAIEITGETDRVYLNTTGACVIHDAALSRRVLVEKENSHTTVVWNPWEAKARAMSDFGDDEWTRMLCIETCNVMASAVELSPGETHTMTAKYSVESL